MLNPDTPTKLLPSFPSRSPHTVKLYCRSDKQNNDISSFQFRDMYPMQMKQSIDAFFLFSSFAHNSFQSRKGNEIPIQTEKR